MGIRINLYLITTAIFALLLSIPLSSTQQLRDCSRSEYNRCISLADPLLKEPHLVFPDNMQDIELVCLTWNQFVDCLKSYTDRCFTPQQRRQFNKAVENPIESVHQMCTQRSYQQEYLKHATCIKSTVTQPQHCGDQYSQLVDQVSQGEAISRASLCCSHDRFRRCVTREARRMCDRGVPNGHAVRFAEQIIDKALSFLQDQCYNYIPNSGDCNSVSYKTDDQLALSTSPWYTSRGGNSRDSGLGGSLGGDLDTLSTDMTILEMSSSPDLHHSPGGPGSSPGDRHGISSGDRHGISSGDRHGISSGIPGAPNLQAVDTRVTDMSWLSSVTDQEGMSSPGFKDGLGSTIGAGGRGDSSSGTSLGTRTRPSSYGRSSGWDTSPVGASSTTPSTVPDWATRTTWHVYSTGDRSGDRTDNNNLPGNAAGMNVGGSSNSFSPFSNPSTNVETSRGTTFTEIKTTETWYPVAGSYAGNEVDEPNQLGLSKPKSGAGLPQKAVAVELSLTMVATVLVAYC